jgi:hypothetical protein
MPPRQPEGLNRPRAPRPPRQPMPAVGAGRGGPAIRLTSPSCASISRPSSEDGWRATSCARPRALARSPPGQPATCWGESVVKLVITNGVGVANVTHLGRGPTAAQRVAMLWSSPGCEVQGCSSTIGIEIDHRLPWADDRVTELANLDPRCGHHRLKTHHGWALIAGTGKRPVVPPPAASREPGARTGGRPTLGRARPCERGPRPRGVDRREVIARPTTPRSESVRRRRLTPTGQVAHPRERSTARSQRA